MLSLGDQESSLQAAIASSVTVFVASSVSFFIIGFLCQHLAHVCCKPKPLSESGSLSEERPTVPLYDDVIPQQKTQEQLELNENVAYGRTS